MPAGVEPRVTGRESNACRHRAWDGYKWNSRKKSAAVRLMSMRQGALHRWPGRGRPNVLPSDFLLPHYTRCTILYVTSALGSLIPRYPATEFTHEGGRKGLPNPAPVHWR
jgi:hypothetical protein